MKQIDLSRITWRDGLIASINPIATLYFPTEKDLIAMQSRLLEQGEWNEEKGKNQIIVKGSQHSIFYTDHLTESALTAIRNHIKLWNKARAIARKKVGGWNWWFGNEYFRRAATLRQMDNAKELIDSQKGDAISGK